MSKKVLIVDDDYAFSSFARRLIEDNQWQATVVATGEAALHAAKSDPPDLILLDLNLPDLSGAEVLKALKNDPQTARIPIAICSISFESKVLEACLALGADKILSKPLNPPVAIPQIKALLSIHEA